MDSADEQVYRSLYEKASVSRKHRADRYLRQEDKLRTVAAAALLKNLLRPVLPAPADLMSVVPLRHADGNEPDSHSARRSTACQL